MENLDELLFMNTEIQDGINTVICRGEEWMTVPLGHQVDIKDRETGDFIHRVEIVGKFNIIFDLIPEEFLTYQHASEYQTKEGVLNALNQQYEDFNIGETCTMLFFVLVLEEGEVSPVL